MNSKLIRVLLAIAVVGILVGIYVFLHWDEQSTDDAAIEAHIVNIAPKVSGYIKVLSINDNQMVKAGDILLQIDPADYIFRRDKAKAALDAALASHVSLRQNLATTQVSAPSNLSAAKAQVASAEATWAKAAKDLKRMQHLSDQARSRQQLDEVVAAEKTAKANLEDAKSKLLTAQTAPKTIAAAKATAEEQAAQAKAAKAELDQAEKDLADTKIIAPMDGRIIKSGVEKGDYIQPGQQLGYLIGNDVWVVANFKETQITHMRPGDRVAIHLDAFPAAKIEGKVDSFQAGTGGRFSAFPPENATGNFVKVVQRVPVKILLNNPPDPALAIGPGMSVEPTVYTSR